MVEFGGRFDGEGDRMRKFWVSHMVLWLHSAVIILIKGCPAHPTSQKCSGENKVLSFLLTLSSLGLGNCAGPAEEYEGTGDIHSTNSY